MSFVVPDEQNFPFSFYTLIVTPCTNFAQAQQIKNDLAEQQKNDNLMNLLMEVAAELQQSEVTLGQGEKQQKTRENFLAQVNASYEKADQAVKLGVRIQEEAQQTLSTLQGR